MSAFAPFDDDDIVTSGEYALRLLEGEDRVRFEGRLASDPGLRCLLAAWYERLARMADDIAEVAPPERVRRAVRARLFGREARRGWWMLGGALAALALAAFLMLPVLLPQRPAFRAEVAADDRSLVVAAAIFPPEHIVEVTFLAGTAPPGRVLELWVIDQGQPAPLSLGLLPEGGTARLEVPQNVQDAGLDLATATLAISEEPPGGSPTGVPTGAVLALGPVVVQ